MFWDRALFDQYTPCIGEHVELGDGSQIPVHGRGSVNILLGGYSVRFEDCLHVPDLDMLLISIVTHGERGEGCGFWSDGRGTVLAFPDFVIDVDAKNEMTIACTGNPNPGALDFDTA